MAHWDYLGPPTDSCFCFIHLIRPRTPLSAASDLEADVQQSRIGQCLERTLDPITGA